MIKRTGVHVIPVFILSFREFCLSKCSLSCFPCVSHPNQIKQADVDLIGYPMSLRLGKLRSFCGRNENPGDISAHSQLRISGNR